ncbi:transposase family protein [Streptomyces goshikiensis]|uniref:helix-turn-helix domain-containing protein n=1 Tax=Streptomyces goshikiensis TaxID=1942 RepID=UPI00364BB5C0
MHQLVFIDRLLATLVHLRHGATHDVLACWYGVDRSTVTRAIGEVRPLLAERGCTISQGLRLRTRSSPARTSRTPSRPWSSPTRKGGCCLQPGRARKLRRHHPRPLVGPGQAPRRRPRRGVGAGVGVAGY